MSFTTIDFIIFFSIVLFFYYLSPGKYRWVILLCASYYFYMSWEPLYALILFTSTIIDYFCGLWIGRAKNPKIRRHYFILSLFSNLGLLFFFKYLDFFNSGIKEFLQLFNIQYTVSVFNLVIPLGLSYFTFKKIGYIVDVYRDNIKPERHLGKFSLYVSFFPAIIAGPIDRSKDLLPQLKCIYGFDYSRIVGGLTLVIFGMFKKIVVADRLADYVHMVYDHPQAFQGLDLVIATLFFSIQIFADFSGYSDMAVGIAQIMGYQLVNNFNRPYFAISITDFWKRWHISLTTWLRDYLFLPLAYAISRKIRKESFLKIKAETWTYVIGIVITMFICGFWHGANWTFIVWGGLHGLYLTLSFASRKMRRKWRKKIFVFLKPQLKPIYKGLQIISTFLCVSFLWIFFRAHSISDAVYIGSNLLKGLDVSSTLLSKGIDLYITLGMIVFMFLIQMVQNQSEFNIVFAQKPLVIRWAIYIILVLAIMNLGRYNEIPFIYIQY